MENIEAVDWSELPDIVFVVSSHPVYSIVHSLGDKWQQILVGRN